MYLNLFSLFAFYWLSIFSCLGYGLFISKILNSKISVNNYGYQGLFGVLFLTLYSYISNFFYSHSSTHNTFLVIIGIVLFFYFVYFKYFNLKKLKIFSYIFLICFISFVIFKPHDDFSYYHFQYSYYLTQFPLMIGMGQFNHGFATPSSIFYLNSLFYLPYAKYALFHMPSLLVFGFSNLIFIEKLFNYLEKKKPNFLTLFLLFSIAFVNIIFYRLAEHGTDRSAQILVFLLIFELLVLINFEKNFQSSLSKIFILLALIISFKAFYILYFIFFIPIFIYGYGLFKFNVITLILKKKSFYIFCATFFILILTNFFNTGCFIFPVSITCFENLPWSFSINHVNHMNDWYEQWSKAGAGPNFRVENAEEYILKFNWFNNWINEYFFNKVSDFLLGLICIIIIPSIFIISFKEKNNFLKRKIISVYICLIVLFIEWFYNHPSLRYGGYVLFGLILFIPTSIFLEKFLKKNINNIISFFIILFFLIFSFRNFDRINNEYEKYKFNPFENAHYRVNENYFTIDKELKKLTENFDKCSKLKNCDDKLDIKMGKILGKIYFFNEQ